VVNWKHGSSCYRRYTKQLLTSEMNWSTCSGDSQLSNTAACLQVQGGFKDVHVQVENSSVQSSSW
jgi:hypothetical protein